MKWKVPVGISNHHVHLTIDTYQKLFDEPLIKERDLNQKNEFASRQFVAIEGPKGKLEKIRVMGPFRTYNQVEISFSDAYFLGVNPPVRKSGDLQNSETITIHGPKGSVILENACILAENHIHMNLNDLKTLGLKEDEVVKVIVKKERAGIFYAHIKSNENYSMEFHIDRDEANAFLLKNGEELTVETLEEGNTHEMENWKC